MPSAKLARTFLAVGVALAPACSSAAKPTAPVRHADDVASDPGPISWADPEALGDGALRADLDGDGVAEMISVDAATIRIGDATFQTSLRAFRDVAEEQDACRVELRVIDIDMTDRQREVVASCTLTDALPDEYVLAYAGGVITALAKTDAEIKTTGDGTASTQSFQCGETRTTRFALEHGLLVEKHVETEGTYDEAECCC
jgi:hypothetical protein